MLDDMLAHVDLIEFVISVMDSLLCVYIAQVILREHSPMVDLQRVALFALGVGILWNGVSSFPVWVGMYRPTGVLVYFLVFLNLLVMAIRGRVMRQGSGDL
jgi:hypothetical protein